MYFTIKVQKKKKYGYNMNCFYSSELYTFLSQIFQDLVVIQVVNREAEEVVAAIKGINPIKVI